MVEPADLTNHLLYPWQLQQRISPAVNMFDGWNDGYYQPFVSVAGTTMDLTSC